VQEVIDYSGLEYDNLFLEGTGAMVFDHLERVAYVASSHRADPVILERFCTAFGYEPMVFPTADHTGRTIYHTNVLMTIATEYALVCLAAISDAKRRAEVSDAAGGERAAGAGPDLRAGGGVRRATRSSSPVRTGACWHCRPGRPRR
jgi:hypothetical protein